MAGIAHEEDSAPEWFAAQFPNIGEALPAALCEGLTANLLHLFEVNMELKKLLEEISALEFEIRSTDALLGQVNQYGLKLCVVVSNNTQYRGIADQEFLIDALKSKRSEMHERLVKLIEAVGVVEKVIDGLVA